MVPKLDEKKYKISFSVYDIEEAHLRLHVIQSLEIG